MITPNPRISARLAIPDSVMLAGLFPANNRWATGLLCRLLRISIEAAGVTVNRADFAFQLNNSFFLFTVDKRPAGPALAAVQEELAAVGLKAWAQIAWHDVNELVWRIYYPDSGIFRAPSREEFEAESRLASEQQEAIQKLQQRDEPPGQ